MFWQEWSERFRKELKLATHPIAVTMTGAQASGAASSAGKLSVCQALKKASEGETVTITAETCGCPGGLVSLGLGQMPAVGRERLVDFLVNREKVFCSRVSIHRAQQTVPPPLGVASHVVFAPLVTATLLPDLVLFVGTPGSLHQLLTLASYWDGRSVKAELAGPACRTAIAFPVVTGEIGLSLLDFGARRLAAFREDQLIVSVPLHRMFGIVRALDQGLGAEREEELEGVEREIEALGAVEAV